MSRLPAVLVRLKLRGLFCETANMTELPASKIRVEWPLVFRNVFPKGPQASLRGPTIRNRTSPAGVQATVPALTPGSGVFSSGFPCSNGLWNANPCHS